jgi:hypothetical protein
VRHARSCRAAPTRARRRLVIVVVVVAVAAVVADLEALREAVREAFCVALENSPSISRRLTAARFGDFAMAMAPEV